MSVEEGTTAGDRIVLILTVLGGLALIGMGSGLSAVVGLLPI